MPVPSLKEDNDVLANKVYSVITNLYEAACPLQKSLRKKDNIWWNSELASLQKESRRAWRKATKTKQEEEYLFQMCIRFHQLKNSRLQNKRIKSL